MNRATFLSAIMALLASCAPALHAAPERPAAVHALYTMASPALPYSFSDLFRLSLEAEAQMTGSGTGDAPAGMGPVSLPAAVSVGPRAVSAPVPSGPAEVQTAQRWPLQQPGGWLMLVSGLAVIGFIAWRRSEGGQ